MAVKQQQEYIVYNLKGEAIATSVVTGDKDNISQVLYDAGVPQEYVDPVKNSAHQPTKKQKL